MKIQNTPSAPLPRFGQVYKVQLKNLPQGMSPTHQASALARNIQGHLKMRLWPWHHQVNPSASPTPPEEVAFTILMRPSKNPDKPNFYLAIGKASDSVREFLKQQQDKLLGTRSLDPEETKQAVATWLNNNKPAGQLAIRFKQYGQMGRNDYTGLLALQKDAPIRFPDEVWSIESVQKPKDLRILKHLAD